MKPITLSPKILGNYLDEEGFEKKALLDSFVERVCVYKDRRISVKVDIFGRKASFESDDLSKLNDLEKMGFKSCETVECLYSHQRGFVPVGHLPKRGKKSEGYPRLC